MNTHSPLLGVLGGLGPMSTFLFCQMLTSHTKACCDADHIDMIISSRATTPDRTAFILGESAHDPLPVMRTETARLCQAGAELIVIPCNTAHYFYDGLQSSCSVPILNIIRETVSFLHQRGIQRFGLLATEGTVASRAYHRVCEPLGLSCEIPAEHEQKTVTDLIYGQIKQNKPVDLAVLSSLAASMQARGCEVIVLGCTELSILKGQGLDDNVFIDSLEILAYRTILACGKAPVGFPERFCLKEHDI